MAMIRLRTSQVELTSPDVAYTIRRIVLQRRAVRAAESAAALALQNAKIKGILSKFPDEHSLRSEYNSGDGSIISEEPVVRGHREFWRKIVAEAGAIDNAAIEDGDAATVPTSSDTQDESRLTDDSSVLRREDDVKQEESCYKNRGCDPRTDDFKQNEQGGTLDGVCDIVYDGTSGGSEFCSPSISVSSFGWPKRVVGDGKRGDGDGSDEDPSSSEFEEDVPSDSELSPRMSQLGDSRLSQRRVKVISAEEEASFFALHHSFSAQLNFDGASESPSDYFSLSRSSFLSPPLRVPDSPLPSPLSGSANTQARLHGAVHRSPPRVTRFSSPRTGELTMGLPIWRNSDYEAPTPQRVRRYRPRTSTYSFEESEPASSHGHTETQDRNAQVAQASGDAVTQMIGDTVPLATDGDMPQDDNQSLRQPSVTSGPTQRPDAGTVLSSHGGSRSSEPRGPDRSPVRFVHQSPIITVPPPSPIPQDIGNNTERLPDPISSTQRIQVYNDNHSTRTRHRRTHRTPASVTRTPSANAHALTRLHRASGVNLPEVLENVMENVVENTMETNRERRGRELALPDSWILNAQTARQEFDERMGLNGERRGIGRESEISEEL